MTANILGKVFLVGAGPGDPGLLTLKGKRYLEAADVIFYDQLVNGELLEFAHADAELIDVGKRAGEHCVEQKDIEAQLIQKAREGKIVVRLKGGDPFVFGRGGEEAEALSAMGIPYEIVPGVSSAIAAPASAGIPVTHRSCSSSLAIVTGHKAHSGCPEVKWRDLARSVDTIVILMGLHNLRRIMNQLLEGGCEPGWPVALIQSGTRPSQRTLVATVATIADLMEGAGFKSPTLIVVGEVVNFRRRLQWRESIIRDDTLVARCETLDATPWTHYV